LDVNLAGGPNGRVLATTEMFSAIEHGNATQPGILAEETDFSTSPGGLRGVGGGGAGGGGQREGDTPSSARGAGIALPAFAGCRMDPPVVLRNYRAIHEYRLDLPPAESS